MKNIFNSVKMQRPNKNVFDLSHDVKMSLNMGELAPTLCMECVPGDSFNIGCDSLLRLSPLVAPVMHRCDVYMHYFFVPNRILWPNWEQFITEPDTLTPPPLITMVDANYTKLCDYLGIPIPDIITGETELVSALPFAAYQMIYNEYYRDQNLNAKVDDQLINGDNDATTDLFVLRYRSWEHDYFTSALPFAQKGNPVEIPLGTVELNPDWSAALPTDPVFRNPNQTVAGGTLEGDNIANQIDAGGVGPVAYDPQGSLNVEPTTINELRRAFRLQEWLEKAARGGTRYIEQILSHFGVRSSDKRLQRPEYITGTKSPIIISEVLQSGETGTSPQGNMAGHGVGVTTGKYGRYFCEEHGYIIGIMSVMPKTAYQQGVPKHFLKTDPFEYFWPSFAHIGEQEILQKEIYAYTLSSEDVFGYTPRYAEYKFMSNRVAGDFRSSLDFWHMGRIFATPPALNGTFVKADPTDRIFAVTDPTVDKLYAHVLHKIRAVRPMPKFGTPTF